MCWSAQASLTFLIVGWAFCITLIIRNKPMDRLWGIFWMFVLSMQFLEFLIWEDQPKQGSSDCNTGRFKGNLNNVASQIAAIQNLLQPLAIILLVAILIPQQNLPVPRDVIVITVGVYFIGLVIWMFESKIYKKRLCTIPCGSEKHHLRWTWTAGSNQNKPGNWVWAMYWIALAAAVFFLSKFVGGLILSGFSAFILIVSVAIYPFNKSSGSWWCVLAVLAPLVKILLPTGDMMKNVW